MYNQRIIKGFSKILIILVGIFLTFLPIFAIIAPIQFIGNLFKNSWGSVKEYFNVSEYDGNLSEDIDTYASLTRISVDYENLIACTFNDFKDDPNECLSNVSDDGSIKTDFTDNNFFEVDWSEYHGKFDNQYFKDIHILGKYTTSNYEVVGHHTEYENIIDEYGNVVGQKEIIVDDYDWVYHPELKRGKCIESSNQKCYIELEDRDTYPFNYSGAYISDRYGIAVDKDNLSITLNPWQIWFGDALYAFSKGEVVEADSNHIKIKIIANNIDLFAVYEGSLTSLFSVGDIVEATELIGYNNSDTFNLSVHNSNMEYINPSLFLDSNNIVFGDNYDLSLIPNGHLLIGALANYQPDFTNLDAWVNLNPYANGNMGQCTWFAWGMFYQLYGYDPGFRGNGSTCAANTNGFEYTQSPTPGSVFSVVSSGGGIHSYGHVGIVAEVIDENTMVIIHGNKNANLVQDSWNTAINDWTVSIVNTEYYTYRDGTKARFVFANP